MFCCITVVHFHCLQSLIYFQIRSLPIISLCVWIKPKIILIFVILSYIFEFFLYFRVFGSCFEFFLVPVYDPALTAKFAH